MPVSVVLRSVCPEASTPPPADSLHLVTFITDSSLVKLCEMSVTPSSSTLTPNCTLPKYLSSFIQCRLVLLSHGVALSNTSCQGFCTPVHFFRMHFLNPSGDRKTFHTETFHAESPADAPVTVFVVKIHNTRHDRVIKQ